MNGRIDEELEKRNLPEFTGREKAEALLRQNLYGQLPFWDERITYEVLKQEPDGIGGRAQIWTVAVHAVDYHAAAAFTFYVMLPKGQSRPPIFFYLSFHPEIEEPVAELLLDHGYALAHIYYQDIAADWPDHFQSGFGRLGNRNPYSSAGKLALWAFGLSKAADYVLKENLADPERMAVIGHSRLGKAALAAGAFDSRFSLTAAVQSGAAGIALFRGKTGEQLRDLERGSSRDWLCGQAYIYTERISELPFDQHFLPALIAPRRLYIASAQKDAWADPLSEYLACAAGSAYYRKLGRSGLIRTRQEEMLFEAPDDSKGLWGILGRSAEGEIGWHYRKGTHYFSICDWKEILAYRKRHNV